MSAPGDDELMRRWLAPWLPTAAAALLVLALAAGLL